MFACLYSLSVPLAALVKIAEDFTPRFEVVGPLVMLDVSGLARLFGSPQEIGDQLRRAAVGPVRIALAPTQTAAALLALGRAGLSVVLPGEQPERLAPLAVSLMGDFDRMRLDPAQNGRASAAPVRQKEISRPPQVSAMEDVLPYFTSCLDRTTETVVTAHCGGGGWMHPRDSHAANQTRRSRRASETARDTVHADVSNALLAEPSAPGTRHLAPGTWHPAAGTPHPAPGTWHPARGTPHPAPGTAPDTPHPAPGTRHPAPGTRHSAPGTRHSAPGTRHSAPGTRHSAPGTRHSAPGTRHSAPGTRHPAPGTRHLAPGTWHSAPGTRHPAPGTLHPAPRTPHAALAEIHSLQATLRRWGVKTLGALAGLQPGEVYERLGARGVLWQRLARGQDTTPLVPWIPEDPFEAALDLEWPIEGLEPLSFVLSRLLEPLAERMERADRGAAILHTHLRLVSKDVHARTLQLPAPMRDPKTLRTLMLLDLESNPPTAAIDQVRVLVEPTPARVMQWMLFERAQPSPEQVSTLLARLSALMGETHVGSPRLLDSWKPGAFEMGIFQVRSAGCGVRGAGAKYDVQGTGAKCDVQGAGAKCDVQGAGAKCDVQGAGAKCDVQGAGSKCDVPAALVVQQSNCDLGTPYANSVPSTPHSHAALGTRYSNATPRMPHSALASALRRFRLPVPARVQVQEGRPIRVATDRRGVTGGRVVQAAGPWRTSGEWWNDAQFGQVGRVGQVGQDSTHQPHPAYPADQAHLTYPAYSTQWDRDEWDVAIADGTVYRLYVERDVGQWFIEGVVD